MINTKVVTTQISFCTKAEQDWKDLTSDIQKIIEKSKILNGLVNVSAPGSTGSVLTIEAEKGLIEDLLGFVEEYLPRQGLKNYKHELRWHDGNAHSHLRSTLLGSNITLPIINGELILGTWQQIVFIEFDIRSRNRTVYVHCFGI